MKLTLPTPTTFSASAAVERQVQLVGDEAGRAVGIDQVLAVDAGRIAEVGGLAARVDRRSPGCRPGTPSRSAPKYCGKCAHVHRADVLHEAAAVAGRDEEADVAVAGQRQRRRAARDHAAQLADLLLQLGSWARPRPALRLRRPRRPPRRAAPRARLRPGRARARRRRRADAANNMSESPPARRVAITVAAPSPTWRRRVRRSAFRGTRPGRRSPPPTGRSA